jgi:acetyltransferase-like isoleucine patch superfamily enzyme
MVIKLFFRPIFFRIKKIVSICRLKRKYPDLAVGDYVTIISSSFEGSNSVANNSLISECVFGKYSYSGNNAFICRAKIGRFTCIGPNVSIGLAKHPVENIASVHPVFYSFRVKSGASFVKSNKFDELSETVYIGNDVWIGEGVTIPGGVTIGDGAIIASGAVVVKDVGPYEIVGGVPAKRIKYRFSIAARSALIEMAWWDKDEVWLKKHSSYFEDVEKLIKIMRKEREDEARS